jgi:hypothetical protein
LQGAGKDRLPGGLLALSKEKGTLLQQKEKSIEMPVMCRHCRLISHLKQDTGCFVTIRKARPETKSTLLSAKFVKPVTGCSQVSLGAWERL